MNGLVGDEQGYVVSCVQSFKISLSVCVRAVVDPFFLIVWCSCAQMVV